MTATLDGTVALVTGASSGIGEAVARALAGHGAAVAGAARRRDRLDALVAAIEADDGRALAIEADVTDQQQAIAAVERTVAELGRLDIVINNAGVMLLGPIVDAPTEEWDRMVAINVNALMYVAHAALPHLLRAAEDAPRRVADLVNVSSLAGRRATLNSGVYNATKFAVNAFTEALRQEVTERHVRVSVVEPGAVATELRTHLRAEIREQQARMLADIEPLAADDAADVIAYIVTRARHVAINEVLMRPTQQVR
jgi:NADP-dependent 3-hydroxy acid dehydrogenase YdfG